MTNSVDDIMFWGRIFFCKSLFRVGCCFGDDFFVASHYFEISTRKKNSSAKHNTRNNDLQFLLEKNDLQKKNRPQNIMCSTKNKVVIDLGLHVTGMRQKK